MVGELGFENGSEPQSGQPDSASHDQFQPEVPDNIGDPHRGLSPGSTSHDPIPCSNVADVAVSLLPTLERAKVALENDDVAMIESMLARAIDLLRRNQWLMTCEHRHD